MAGRWDADGDALRFTPRFPFSGGTSYALVRPDGTGWVEVARLRRPAVDNPPIATVVAIHPTAPEVPENLLRFSVTFSASMAEGHVTGRVHLRDGDGRDIPYALLPTPPELWDRPRRRLTLLLEPGRIKRGLGPNTELGPPLVDGSAVRLVVDADLRDAAGVPLVAGARRDYLVGPAVRTRVDPARWQVTWPPPGSRDPLVVDFDRPLDHALALRCLRPSTSDGAVPPGHAALGRGDARWVFTPGSPWPGPGRLHVDTTLEDLAGNSVRKVFDRDLRLHQDDPLDATELIVEP
jgi:hypothetical protein